MNNKKIPRSIEVVITGKYNGYNDFFEKNKTKIYSGILECFDLLSTSNRKTIKYLVSASTVSELVGSVDFTTEFLFRKSDSNILTDFVLDHFEFIEDYEKCQKIIDIEKLLTNSNKSDKLEITNV
jgi:hypothetical protein